MPLALLPLLLPLLQLSLLLLLLLPLPPLLLLLLLRLLLLILLLLCLIRTGRDRTVGGLGGGKKRKHVLILFLLVRGSAASFLSELIIHRLLHILNFTVFLLLYYCLLAAAVASFASRNGVGLHLSHPAIILSATIAGVPGDSSWAVAVGLAVKSRRISEQQ